VNYEDNSNTHLRLACNPAEAMPKLIDSKLFPKDLINFSFVSIFLFDSQRMIYDKYREDPVFSATSKATESDDHRNAYVNNELLPGILSCIDNTYICDSELGMCWNYPAKPMVIHDVNNFMAVYWPNIDGPSRSIDGTDPNSVYVSEPFYGFPSVYNRTSGETTFTGIWDRAINSSATEAELSLALLVHVLWGSTLCFMWQEWRRIEATSLCGNSIICRDLPPDQGKPKSANCSKPLWLRYNTLFWKLYEAAMSPGIWIMKVFPRDSEVYAKWASLRVSVGAT
jgi:hypothetical protein